MSTVISVSKRHDSTQYRLRTGELVRYRSKKARWYVYMIDDAGRISCQRISAVEVPVWKARKVKSHGYQCGSCLKRFRVWGKRDDCPGCGSLHISALGRLCTTSVPGVLGPRRIGAVLPV